jgi:hypothetical protein
MKKNFKAVYEFKGEEVIIKTPVSLGLLNELQLALLGEDEDEKVLSEKDDIIFEKTYDFIEEQVIELFTKETGIYGDFEVAFKIPQENDKYSFRVEIIELEEPNFVEEEKETKEMMITEKSVLLGGYHRGISVTKKEENHNVLHIKSLTSEVGKGAGVTSFLSADEEIKNSLLGLSDDALLDVAFALANYAEEVLGVSVLKEK